MRGRIFSVASEWIGRPLDSISIVTMPALPSRLMELTAPTFTPAIRTGDLGWMFWADANTAFRR
jgi:hypothetical protein